MECYGVVELLVFASAARGVVGERVGGQGGHCGKRGES